jgi:hypothetical protein
MSQGSRCELEAQLCLWRQIFTSKTSPPLGRLAILNVDFLNEKF